MRRSAWWIVSIPNPSESIINTAENFKHSNYLLGFDLGDVVNLFRQLVDGILLLLAQSLDLLLALDLSFLQIAAQLLQFLFALLVDVNLANRMSIN